MAKLYIGNTAYKVMLGNNSGHIADLPTVVWNQQIVNSSISGSQNKNTYTYLIASLSTNRYVFKGHKVRVKGRVKFDATPSGSLILQIDNDFILTRTGSDFLPDTFYEFSTLTTISTEAWHEFRFYATKVGEATKLTWENVNVIDLTLMFGAGNEPTSVAQFEQWFTDNIGSLDNYYPYNEGEEIKVKYLPQYMQLT